ncbi:hypothetical protein BA6E_10530 [Bacteroidales bacterium 6E]|nr:hypothetical protein BA6E_10530 [Bacteroidales bacterium 6E]
MVSENLLNELLNSEITFKKTTIVWIFFSHHYFLEKHFWGLEKYSTFVAPYRVKQSIITDCPEGKKF